MGLIKGVITDFDGTLVNTFQANYNAYKETFSKFDKTLTPEKYKECFGLRYDALCDALNVDKNIRKEIKELKKLYYKKYFSYMKVNVNLLKFIKLCKENNVMTCIASTASKDNLYNVIDYFQIEDYFDIIIAGEDVSKGKPDPEIYNIALSKIGCNSNEAIVFEDSETGVNAAIAANIPYIKIENF